MLRTTPSAILALLFIACGSAAVVDEEADASGGQSDGVGVDGGSDAGEGSDAGDVGGGADSDAGLDAGSDADSGTDADAGDETDAGAVEITPFRGDCSPSFPGVASLVWRHDFSSPIVIAQGEANHRNRDVIVQPGEAFSLRVHLTYGIFDKDLEDEDVELWVRRCPDWERVGSFTSNDDGVAFGAMPTDLPKGEYKVRWLVHGDGSSVDGVAAIWPSGTEAVITDIDGTLTTSDWQAVQDLAGGTADMYPDADQAMLRWKDKGYRILYLTGRPQVVNRYSRGWLDDRGMPTGPMQLTDSAGQIWPTDGSVRAFKGGRLQELAAEGIHWRAAYGNASTDIGAYADAAIPKADTYIIGANAGDEGTQPLPASYTAHLSVIDGYPDAVQP